MMNVPRLPDRELLAELCLETAASEGVLPFAVEKDFYDLDQLLRAGEDFESETFRALVDQKLGELLVLPLSEQTSCFAMTPARRRNLDAATSKGLQGIVRVSDEPFDLDAMLARFDGVFGPGRR